MNNQEIKQSDNPKALQQYYKDDDYYIFLTKEDDGCYYYYNDKISNEYFTSQSIMRITTQSINTNENNFAVLHKNHLFLKLDPLHLPDNMYYIASVDILGTQTYHGINYITKQIYVKNILLITFGHNVFHELRFSSEFISPWKSDNSSQQEKITQHCKDLENFKIKKQLILEKTPRILQLYWQNKKLSKPEEEIIDFIEHNPHLRRTDLFDHVLQLYDSPTESIILNNALKVLHERPMKQSIYVNNDLRKLTTNITTEPLSEYIQWYLIYNVSEGLFYINPHSVSWYVLLYVAEIILNGPNQMNKLADESKQNKSLQYDDDKGKKYVSYLNILPSKKRLYMILHNPNIISFITSPSVAEQLLCVHLNPANLILIKNPCLEAIISAFNKNSNIVSLMNEKTTELLAEHIIKQLPELLCSHDQEFMMRSAEYIENLFRLRLSEASQKLFLELYTCTVRAAVTHEGAAVTHEGAAETNNIDDDKNLNIINHATILIEHISMNKKFVNQSISDLQKLIVRMNPISFQYILKPSESVKAVYKNIFYTSAADV
jgi:hypothetical protein